MKTLDSAIEVLRSSIQKADEIIDCLVLHDDLYRKIVAEIEKESPTVNCDASGLKELAGIRVYTAADNQQVFIEMLKHVSNANCIAYSKKDDDEWKIIVVPCAYIRTTYGIWNSDSRMFFSAGL